MRQLLKIISLMIFAAPAISLAQMDLQDVIQPEEGEPIDITSQSMLIKNKDNLAVFQENVHVTQGKMNMTSNEVRLYTDYDEKTKKSKFKKIESIGNVDFKSLDKWVQADEAVYDVPAGILVLQGNVKMKDSESSLQGKYFRYDVRSGKSEVRNTPKGGAPAAPGSGGRVRAVFTPGEGVKQIQMPSDALKGFKEEKKQKQEKAKAAE
jgi:lipopolysaccharide export system protein LptA